MTPEEMEQIVQKHCTQLREHFEAVQILVSHETDEGQTGSIYTGAGNWYARVGMCRDMLNRDQSETLVNRMPKPPPDSDDSESWKDS